MNILKTIFRIISHSIVILLLFAFYSWSVAPATKISIYQSARIANSFFDFFQTSLQGSCQFVWQNDVVDEYIVLIKPDEKTKDSLKQQIKKREPNGDLRLKSYVIETLEGRNFDKKYPNACLNISKLGNVNVYQKSFYINKCKFIAGFIYDGSTNELIAFRLLNTWI